MVAIGLNEKRECGPMPSMKKAIVIACLAVVPQFSLAETIVKQETVSFEGCLKVIQVTADQIGLAPKLAVDTDALRVAEFSAPDGTVVIKCDRAAKQVTVSIK